MGICSVAEICFSSVVSATVTLSGSPLLDDVVQAVLWLAVLLERFGRRPLPPTHCAGQLLCKSLVLAELLEDGLVEEVLYVFDVVERGRGRGSLVGFFVVLWLAREDAWRCDIRHSVYMARGTA